MSELLGDLAERGFDFNTTRLYILDGDKALSAAVKTHTGESAVIQRRLHSGMTQSSGRLANRYSKKVHLASVLSVKAKAGRETEQA